MVTPRFPHYKETEIPIMQRFLDSKTLLGTYKYSIKLYTPETERDKKQPANYRKMWSALRAKRIDFTVETDQNLWIGELKEMLMPSAIGQVIMYAKMYARQFKPSKTIKTIIVAGVDDVSTRQVAGELGIRVVIV